MIRPKGSEKVCRKAEQPERGHGLPKTVEANAFDSLLIDNHLSFGKAVSIWHGVCLSKR
jgi:hypothetical protein